MTKPKKLRPKENCYKAAASLLIMPGPEPLPDEAVLVHGRPVLQRKPFCEYGHAWVEIEERVVDRTNGYDGPRVVYYALGQIDWRNCLLYTRNEARAFVVTTEHFGPWEGPDADARTREILQERVDAGEPLKRSRDAVLPRLTVGMTDEKLPLRSRPKASSKRTQRKLKKSERLTAEDVEDFT